MKQADVDSNGRGSVHPRQASFKYWEASVTCKAHPKGCEVHFTALQLINLGLLCLCWLKLMLQFCSVHPQFRTFLQCTLEHDDYYQPFLEMLGLDKVSKEGEKLDEEIKGSAMKQ